MHAAICSQASQVLPAANQSLVTLRRVAVQGDKS